MKFNRRSLFAGALGLLGAKKATPTPKPTVPRIGCSFISYNKPDGSKGAMFFQNGILREIR